MLCFCFALFCYICKNLDFPKVDDCFYRWNLTVILIALKPPLPVTLACLDVRKG